MQDTPGRARAGEPIIASGSCPAQFERRSRVERHRLVYDLLTAEFADGLHALALVAKAPGEP